MSEKYLIFGATGSIGSSLSRQLKQSGKEVHLVARNESEVKKLSEELGCSFTVADVLENGFVDKVKAEVPDVKGIAYCVGSIVLKPLRMIKEDEFNQCMKLNCYSALEVIRGYQDTLKKVKDQSFYFQLLQLEEVLVIME